jgi:cardiolipin synthase (CMP-forming)
MSKTNGDSTVPPSSDRIVTVPNAMSLVRLCCIPLFLYMLFGRDNRAGAAFLLAGLGATDWIDGYIARRFNQVSELGKVLDPTADRLMFIVGIGGIIIDGRGPQWFYWLVVLREAILGLIIVVATVAGMKRFDVTWWGKTATFFLMGAVPSLLVGSSDLWLNTEFRVAGWIMGIPGLALSYWTAAVYMPVIWNNLQAGRQERSTKHAEKHP